MYTLYLIVKPSEHLVPYCEPGNTLYLIMKCSILIEIQDYLLLPTESTGLHQISLDTPLRADIRLPVRNFRAVSSVAVDTVYDEVYWTDKLESQIIRDSLSGGRRRVLISEDLITPEALVVDWVGRNMYWADSGTGRVEVSDLNGRKRRVLVSSNLTHVTSLAMDLKSQ